MLCLTSWPLDERSRSFWAVTMGCGASAARAAVSPHAVASSLAPPSTDTNKEPSEAQAGVGGPAAVAAEPDELEGLLAALEEHADSKSRRTGTPATQPQDAGGQRPEGALRNGDLEQLLSELQEETEEDCARTSSKPTALAALAAPLAALTPPGPAPARQLAPLKVTGRAPIASRLAPAPAVQLPQGSPAAGRAGVSPTSPGAMRGSTWAGSWVAELEPPDSVTLLSIDHRGGRGSASRASSLGSPSTASTTYITFDLLPDGDRTSAEGEGEGEGSLGRGSAAGAGAGGAGLAGGREEPLRRSGAQSARDGLEQKAAEVDELLRDVFEDHAGPQPRPRAGAGAAPAAVVGVKGQEGLVGGEKLRGIDESDGHGKLQPRTERPGSNTDEAGRRWEGTLASRKLAADAGAEGPPTTGWQSGKSGEVAATISNRTSSLKHLEEKRVDGSGHDVTNGELPGIWQRREAGEEEGRREDGANILDLDDLEDIARDEDIEGEASQWGAGMMPGKRSDGNGGHLEYNNLHFEEDERSDTQSGDNVERWSCRGRRSSSNVEPASTEYVLEVDTLELEEDA
ncbi:hypothetical protein KFL_006060080 [Klebsormidium nitens]|uniref:Uncharacterized protein n=1 Tax=Klebsormidium nitens TaxID=105231 RepID=A0A1Y1IH20_KLENI|nr:hypothetical protein KFL_006060080 [Klebsormidium nitens]|eukprot:GAQ90155.1 hypothetical protein KFL_006060080 [Klebsormidium nitens]